MAFVATVTHAALPWTVATTLASVHNGLESDNMVEKLNNYSCTLPTSPSCHHQYFHPVYA
eukprot:160592-Ditylum_brightwellii.AAC.1